MRVLRQLLQPGFRITSSSLRPSVRWHSTGTTQSTAESASTQLSEGELAIGNKLRENFQGATVQVADISGGCGTFYAVAIEHPSFKGLPTVKQHRMVQEVLKEDITNLHGIQYPLLDVT
ncbi:bola-like protein [Atractiella rhizophila]|nr:bola-like protein [Atractiella rhizophila]